MGANSIPMMKSVGNTVLGVRIGCQAFSRCCLNAVSAAQTKHGQKCLCRASPQHQRLTCGSPPSALLLRRLRASTRTRVVIIVGVGFATFAFEEPHGVVGGKEEQRVSKAALEGDDDVRGLAENGAATSVA